MDSITCRLYWKYAEAESESLGGLNEWRTRNMQSLNLPDIEEHPLSILDINSGSMYANDFLLS